MTAYRFAAGPYLSRRDVIVWLYCQGCLCPTCMPLHVAKCFAGRGLGQT